MSRHYANIKSLDQVKKEYAILQHQIKLSERAVEKDYAQLKKSFMIPRLLMSAVKHFSNLSFLASGVKTGVSLLSLFMKKK